MWRFFVFRGIILLYFFRRLFLWNYCGLIAVSVARKIQGLTNFQRSFWKPEENLEVVEIDLSLQKLQPLKKEDIEKRDRLLKSGSLNDPIFDFADRFRRANYIVISAPYWDLSFPSLLKVFFEHICVCGITFAYDENGVEKGLCRCKELTYITTCGGYLGNYNLGYNYIKGLCGLFGIENTTEYALEGLDIEEKEVSLNNCRVIK